MPLITAIEPQKKNPGRFNVYIDGNYSFAVSRDDLATNKLKVGHSISQDDIRNLINVNDISKIFNRVLNFLSYRPRSKKEIEDYLESKDSKPEINAIVYKKLKKNNLVNDFEFARWWVDNRLRFRPRGKIVLRSELIQKGIEKDIIDEILAKIDAEAQLEIAKKLAQKKSLKYKNLDKQQIYQKLTRFLTSKGFDWETTKSAIDTCFEKM